MAMTAYLDVDQGSDFSVIIDLQNDDGTPMNIGSASLQIYSQFRKSYNSSTAYQFTCEVVDGLAGSFKLKLPGVTSSTIKPGRYLYDVELFDSQANTKNRVVEGIVTINAEITKIP
jgi:hypothetical protein